MKNLQEDIQKQNFKKVYLLYGEEKYLLQQYKDRLQKALVPEGDTMNFSLFQGKKTGNWIERERKKMGIQSTANGTGLGIFLCKKKNGLGHCQSNLLTERVHHPM